MIRRTGQVGGLVIAIMALCLLLLAVLPGTWLARPASSAASAWLGLPVDMKDLTITPFSLTPTAVLHSLRISAAPDSGEFVADVVSISLSVPALFSGKVVLDRLLISDAELTVRIDEQGQANWQSASATNSPQPVSLLDRLRRKKVDDLVLDSVNVHIVNDQLHTDLSLVIEGVASTHDPNKLSRGHATGLADGQPVVLDAEFGFLGELLKLPVAGASPITLDIKASVGDDQLALNGSIVDPATLRQVAAKFSLHIVSPEHWQAFVPVPLPDLPSLALAGELTRDSKDWLLRLFEGQYGNTDISGEIRADSSVNPMNVDARLTSAQLAIDELMSLQIADWMPRAFTGSLDYRAEQVVSQQWPLDTIEVTAVLDSRQFSVLVNQIKLSGGEIDGEIIRDLQSQPVVTQVQLNLKRLDLQQLLPQGGDESAHAGQMAARVELSVTGTTPSSMRSTVDGALVALMTGGWLDTLLQGALGIELAQSLMPGRGAPDESGQECAFMELQANEGIVQLRSLVLNTDTIVYLGDGELDWKHESIDLTIEPHYKKLKSGAVTETVDDAVYVSGALATPVVESVHPFLTRDSAVSVLDATITPAVSLMPFLSDYSDDSDVLCQGLAVALDNPQ